MEGLRICCLLLGLTLPATAVVSQGMLDVPAEGAPYRLRVAVDEVSVSFHALDARGLPVTDLKLDELKLLDNGKPPRKVLAFQFLKDFPIRAGILLDISQSMQAVRTESRSIAIEYARSVLRQGSDQAFVMNFGGLSAVSQSWTQDVPALIDGIRNSHPGAMMGRRADTTALFDALYRACSNEFGPLNKAASANFILLFSDGDDTSSHAVLQQVIEVCQRNNTAIYAFRPGEATSLEGALTLRRLARATGGRVFREGATEEPAGDALRQIENDLRNQYRILYKPAELLPDGSFHRIELGGAGRAVDVAGRSGYYAPSR